MEHLWIGASVLAAAFQAVRFAALKELNRYVTVTVATFVRSLFGLPFCVAYLMAALAYTGQTLPPPNLQLVACAALVGVWQFMATSLLVRVFQLGNFAVGMMLAKTDVIATAIIGSVLFSEAISAWGWLAILVTICGVMLASAGRLTAASWAARDGSAMSLIFGPAARLGLLAGIINAGSYLVLREAILAVDPAVGPLVRSAYAAVIMLVMAVLLVGGWLLLTEREVLRRLSAHPWLCAFVGFTSVGGTVAWFLASALTNASYVAAVAQVQIVFALVLSRYWFRETIRPLEMAGIVAILTGVLLFRFV
jgi:drug/metabolite transporter (DMT)-like permease